MQELTKEQIVALLDLIGEGRRAVERGSVKAKDAVVVAQFLNWVESVEKSLKEAKDKPPVPTPSAPPAAVGA